MKHSSSAFVGKIKKSYTGYEARLEQAQHGDGLSVVNTVYNGESTIKYGLLNIRDAISHIRSFGFTGKIELTKN